jgi:16S rRNA (uracil1498-N3)-methyltransferase
MDKIRLYINSPLNSNVKLAIDEKVTHYLKNVLRLEKGSKVYVFNGKDGEWESSIEFVGKNLSILLPQFQTIPQENDKTTNAIVCIPPIRNTRIAYLAEKLTELGATEIQPIVTTNTNINRTNINKLKANAKEAAEQSQRLSVPDIRPSVYLKEFLNSLSENEEKNVFFLDERKDKSTKVNKIKFNRKTKTYFIIGPEGGFTNEEFKMFDNQNIKGISLGDLILRTETAAISIVSYYNFSTLE